MNAVLSALSVLIQPAINYAEQKLASIGAAFLGSLAIIGASFTNDQRVIGANVIAFWQAKYHAAVAAGASPLDAAEQASTASLNEFAAEEGTEMAKITSMLTSALEISITNGLKS